jgi:NADH-quinone oxidoreductase chain G
MEAERTVCLTIDGQVITCPLGWTVHQAATSVGIHIPTFCNHEKLVPVGACRMCLVEIEGALGLLTSCTTPARDGMVVKVHTSPAAVKARKANLEFLLTNHPLDCPVCDKGGECPLQDQAMQDGPGKSRYVEPKRHKLKRHHLSEFIVLDQERCVLCWRCIRFLDEWADDHELDLFGRGAGTRIDTFPGHPLSSKWQGNTIGLCPVGALTSHVFRFQARVWELTKTPSICPLCSVGCNIVLGVKTNRLRRVTPRENMEVNDVWICDRGRFGHGFVDHPDRLTRPLVRRDGELQEATWEEALELIVRRLKEIMGAGGPQTIGGLGSTRVTNEANYLFQRLMRAVVGTNNLDHLARMPAGATPLRSLPELESKDVIFLVGIDPSAEAPLVELWIKKAVLRHGAALLVASSRRIELGRYCGSWLGYLPGSEVALMNGLARAVLDAGLASPASRVANGPDFEQWLKDYDGERVERETGVPSEVVRQTAETLARAQRAAILYGSGWTWGDRGQANLDAMANLALLLADAEAGFIAEDNNTLGALEMGVVPDLYPGQQPFQDIKTRNRLSNVWGAKLSPVEGLSSEGMMAAALQGTLKAMWILGSDPARDLRLAGAALRAVSLLVVQDLFLTDTAQQADVVLPVASFAETDGSFFNVTGRLQALRAAMRPPGEARPDWWIIVEAARRMADGRQRGAWDFGGPGDVWPEIARISPVYRGVDLGTIGSRGWQRPIPSPVARQTFVLVESQTAPVVPEYPLTLVPRRVLYDRGTMLRCSERIQALVPQAFLLVHPSDAERMALADGDTASVISAGGHLDLTVKVDDGVVPGVAFAPVSLSEAPLSLLFSEGGALPRVRIVK